MWYRKWVIGECRHICYTCKFKKECQHDAEWWMDLNTMGYYEKDNYGQCYDDRDFKE